MYFTDSSGFLSLVCLMIQCLIAWIFAAFFGVLAPSRPVWMHSFHVAFVGWGIGLTAVATRFGTCHVDEASVFKIVDGTLESRAFYGVYLSGKVLLLTGLLRGVAQWRCGRALIPVGLSAALVCVGFVIGFTTSAVEGVLLVQVPFVVAVCALSFRLLRPHDGPDQANLGRATVRVVLLVAGVAWILYGIGTATQLAGVTGVFAPLHQLVRFNSVLDLVLQVVLAGGLIIAVMTDSHDKVVSAQEERDGLRSQVQRDDKLRVSATLISGVAHEINNPLTAIIGYGEDLASSDHAVRAHAVRVVREQAARCRAIVKRMTMIGRRRLLTVSRFRLQELVQRVVDGMRPQLAEAGVDVLRDVPQELRLVADMAGFEQVLTNLLSNAIQVSKPGQQIVIRVEALSEGVQLVVRDHGPGVPDVDHNRIFEPFWTTKRANQGTGLGLAVVDAIVHAHGGKIEISDAEGGGAEFRILWPWRSPTSSDGVPSSESSRSDQKASSDEGSDTTEEHTARTSDLHAQTPVDKPRQAVRLLIIDDEHMVRSTIRRHAEKDGWQVDDVETAELGLARLLSGKDSYDAIVCDMRMPGMSGIEFHDELVKVAPELLNFTLFVTGDLASRAAEEFSLRCRSAVMAKPFAPSELVQRLRQFKP